MSLATLTRRMADAGASADMIAIVMEEVEALQLSLNARRTADRDRKREQRERQKSANVTGQSEDSHRTVTATSHDRVSLDKETTPRPPKKLNPSHVCETRAKGWHRLPEGWVPRQLPPQIQAKVDQWPPGALDDEFADFRRWAANAEDKNGKGRKLDWDQAWRNWIGRRHGERYSRTNGMGRHQPNDGLSATSRAALAVFGAGHERTVPQ